MVKSMTSLYSGSVLTAVFLVLVLCFLKDSHSLPTHPRSSAEPIYDTDDLLQFYSPDAKLGHRQHMVSAEDISKLPAHFQDVIVSAKRSPSAQTSCPPGISERECNYELMAVWIRMLMKENQ